MSGRRLRRALPLLVSTALLGQAGKALADPCKAIPDRGPAPSYLRPGSAFSGPVTYVGDGDSLCVALGPTPDRWVEMRLADFHAPELKSPQGPTARRTLDRVTAGQTLHCVAQKQSYDRVAATCRVGGVSVGDLMRRAGVAEGGRGR
ncbi:thermonuclease family protein [Caulobacter rhizosphaerae]|uniref:thermonuclease family protein n=1 Tax=Caulobacter rhizosphaerae TaxID=2010972 RepID=UPI0013D702BA|nr:nuclease [Caulobacter rhizosphaerae]GGL35791.1 hypothetical protein GCM10010983_35990 [Caulobacter rhizosphaerae]